MSLGTETCTASPLGVKNMACITFFTLVILLVIQGLFTFWLAILDYLCFDAVRNNVSKTHHLLIHS